MGRGNGYKLAGERNDWRLPERRYGCMETGGEKEMFGDLRGKWKWSEISRAEKIVGD